MAPNILRSSICYMLLSAELQWGGVGRSGTMGGVPPGALFWALPKRSIPKTDRYRKDIIHKSR